MTSGSFHLWAFNAESAETQRRGEKDFGISEQCSLRLCALRVPGLGQASLDTILELLFTKGLFTQGTVSEIEILLRELREEFRHR